MKNRFILATLIIIIFLTLLLSGCNDKGDTVSPDIPGTHFFVQLQNEPVDYFGASSEKEVMFIKLQEGTSIPSKIYFNKEGVAKVFLKLDEGGLPDYMVLNEETIIYYRNIRQDKVDLGVYHNGEFITVEDVEVDFNELFDLDAAHKKYKDQLQGKVGDGVTYSGIAINAALWGVAKGITAVAAKSAAAALAIKAAPVLASAVLVGVALEVGKGAAKYVFPEWGAVSTKIVADGYSIWSTATPGELISNMGTIYGYYEDIQDAVNEPIVVTWKDKYKHMNFFINKITPNVISIFGGTTITIDGKGFSNNQGDSRINMSTLPSPVIEIIEWKDNKVVFKIQEGYYDKDGWMAIYSSVDKTNIKLYNIGYPTIKSIKPQTAKIGDLITLNTFHFPTKAKDGIVYFSGEKNKTIKVSNFDTEIVDGQAVAIQVVVPNGAVTGKIYYEAYGIKSNEYNIRIADDLNPYGCEPCNFAVKYSELQKEDVNKGNRNEVFYLYWLVEDNSYTPVRHGPYMAWFDSDRTKMKMCYCNKDGKLDGLYTTWYDNGNKNGESNYKDDKLHGSFTSWKSNGQLYREGTYVNGIMEGLWKHYDLEWGPTGSRKIGWFEGQITNGKQEGKWTGWYAKDQIYCEGTYKDGKKVGIWWYYKEDGSCKNGDDWDNGGKYVKCP